MLQESDYEVLYPLVKDFVIKYECGGNPNRFNADIYQETAFKCLCLMRGKPEWIGITDETLEKYVCKAYKMNNLRDKCYCRNKNEICTETETQIEILGAAIEKDSLDVELISKEIRKIFSADIESLFKKHIINGMSISELEEESGLKGLKYKFRKIKDFLRNSRIIAELKDEYGF